MRNGLFHVSIFLSFVRLSVVREIYMFLISISQLEILSHEQIFTIGQINAYTLQIMDTPIPSPFLCLPSAIARRSNYVLTKRLNEKVKLPYFAFSAVIRSYAH